MANTSSKKSPTISVSLVHALINAYSRLAKEEGLPVLGPLDIAVSDGRVDASVWHKMVSSQAFLINDELLGVKISRFMSVRDFPGFCDLFWVARNVKDALDAVMRYICVYSEDCCFRYKEESGDIYFVLGSKAKDDISYHAVEAIMMTLLRYSKHLGGAGFTQLNFSHQCRIGDDHFYQEAFKLPVKFGQTETSFLLNKTWLDMPLSQLPEPSYRTLGIAERRLALVKSDQRLENQIRYILQKMLVSGDVSSRKVADALGLSLRTFQRHLKQEGIVYKEVLESVRRQQAIEYLNKATYSVHEVAFLVGYNDVRNFFRGFKAWTGHKPGDYRREALRKARQQRQDSSCAC